MAGGWLIAIYGRQSLLILWCPPVKVLDVWATEPFGRPIDCEIKRTIRFNHEPDERWGEVVVKQVMDLCPRTQAQRIRHCQHQQDADDPNPR